MKVNVSQILKDYDGSDLESILVSGKPAKPVMLKEVLKNSLSMLSEDDKNLPGPVRYDRFELCLRISEAKKDVDLSAENITLLKELVGKFYMPIIVGRVYDILDPKSE